MSVSNISARLLIVRMLKGQLSPLEVSDMISIDLEVLIALSDLYSTLEYSLIPEANARVVSYFRTISQYNGLVKAILDAALLQGSTYRVEGLFDAYRVPTEVYNPICLSASKIRCHIEVLADSASNCKATLEVRDLFPKL
jgi:hypothetical protein